MILDAPVAIPAQFVKAPKTGVDLAVKNAGGVVRVATAFDVSRPCVYRWISVDTVPVLNVMAMAHISGIAPIDLVGQDIRALFDQIAQYK